ncbi:hypothetical protein ALC62_06429, partial [Cyphomyrmex costatus]
KQLRNSRGRCDRMIRGRGERRRKRERKKEKMVSPDKNERREQRKGQSNRRSSHVSTEEKKIPWRGKSARGKANNGPIFAPSTPAIFTSTSRSSSLPLRLSLVLPEEVRRRARRRRGIAASHLSRRGPGPAENLPICKRVADGHHCHPADPPPLPSLRMQPPVNHMLPRDIPITNSTPTRTVNHICIIIYSMLPVHILKVYKNIKIGNHGIPFPDFRHNLPFHGSPRRDESRGRVASSYLQDATH